MFQEGTFADLEGVNNVRQLEFSLEPLPDLTPPELSVDVQEQSQTEPLHIEPLQDQV